jgi:Flp pilus assembly protein TadG
MKHRNILRDLRGCQSGASAAEFALIAPLIVLLITATIDFGGLIYTRLQVASAAHAGASYASTQGFNQAAINDATADGASISLATATSSETCGCPDAAMVITPATCGATCASGAVAGRYVTVSASATYPLTYSWPGLSNPVNIATTATVRIP